MANSEHSFIDRHQKAVSLDEGTGFADKFAAFKQEVKGINW
jgi:hypothetical protein